jgi:hypothetical protein
MRHAPQNTRNTPCVQPQGIRVSGTGSFSRPSDSLAVRKPVLRDQCRRAAGSGAGRLAPQSAGLHPNSCEIFIHRLPTTGQSLPGRDVCSRLAVLSRLRRSETEQANHAASLGASTRTAAHRQLVQKQVHNPTVVVMAEPTFASLRRCEEPSGLSKGGEPAPDSHHRAPQGFIGHTGHNYSRFNYRALPSRQIVPQSGSDPLQRPVDLIAGDHKWRADADCVFMGILGKDPPALERLAVATRIARFRVKFDRQH